MVPQSPHSEPDEGVAVFSRATLRARRSELGDTYLQFLATPTLRAGLYELAVGSTDTQQPHTEDELYYVLKGQATLYAGGQRCSVTEGDVVFIGAGVEHRFEAIQADLSLLVFFSEAKP